MKYYWGNILFRYKIIVFYKNIGFVSCVCAFVCVLLYNDTYLLVKPIALFTSQKQYKFVFIKDDNEQILHNIYKIVDLVRYNIN